MQEEVESKVCVLLTNCAKLTEQELKKALGKLLRELRDSARRSAEREPREPHGKMTVKELAAQEKGMQSIEVTDENIGSFNRIARKYGIDFAPFKVKSEKRYLVFFKAPDTDAMTAAFKEYTEKQINKASRPSVLQKLEKLRAAIRNPIKDKTRHKEPER